MKKLMTFICVGFLSASAFADCGLSYDIAAKRRHKIDTVVAWVVSFGALTFLDSYESNRFDQLIDMFKDSQAGRLNGDYAYELNQVVKHSIKKAQLVRTKQLEKKVLALINEGYEKEIF